uniref:Legume lectin domain-containing protein n=1 Tax=Cajanus cajan TaxID=3821 RepID=A0A151QYU2_CAJCA|nr:hypothetical protein KK1_043428 [Cajanus cajan]
MFHVGINNNSKVSLATSWFDIERNIGNMVHALITYNASAKLLSVSWYFDGNTSGFTPNNSLSRTKLIMYYRVNCPKLIIFSHIKANLITFFM